MSTSKLSNFIQLNAPELFGRSDSKNGGRLTMFLVEVGYGEEAGRGRMHYRRYVGVAPSLDEATRLIFFAVENNIRSSLKDQRLSTYHRRDRRAIRSKKGVRRRWKDFSALKEALPLQIECRAAALNGPYGSGVFTVDRSAGIIARVTHLVDINAAGNPGWLGQ